MHDQWQLDNDLNLPNFYEKKNTDVTKQRKPESG